MVKQTLEFGQGSMEILSKRGGKKTERKKEYRVHNYEGEREKGEGTGPRGSTRLANHSPGAAWHILKTFNFQWSQC